MTGRGTNWVDDALREHEEHEAAEQAAGERAEAAGHRGAGHAAASQQADTPSDREQQVLDRIDRARRRSGLPARTSRFGRGRIERPTAPGGSGS